MQFLCQADLTMAFDKHGTYICVYLARFSRFQETSDKISRLKTNPLNKTVVNRNSYTHKEQQKPVNIEQH